MNTRIILPSSGSVDLYGDVPMSLNFSVAEVQEPTKRHGDYSKTISVPGTANNNRLFMNIFDIASDRRFNPHKKAKCIVVQSDEAIMKGYLRLVKINNTSDKLIDYEVEIIGRTGDLFSSIAGKKVSELYWSDLDHTFNRANQITSWSGTVGQGYIYPFIDYGYTTPGNIYYSDRFYPGIYLKEYIDRIFSYAGFQYSSSFLTSNFFKRLFIPFNGDALRLPQATIDARQFRASRATTDQSITITAVKNSGSVAIPTPSSGVVQFNDDSSSPNVNTGGNYSTSSYTYTVPADGFYNFIGYVYLYGKAVPTGSAFITKQIVSRISFYKNGNETISTTSSNNFHFNQNFTCSATSSTLTSATQMFPINYSGQFVAGDQITMRLNGYLTDTICNGSGTVTYSMNIEKNNSFMYCVVDPIVKNGTTIEMQSAVPQDLKMSDLLSSIFKMFNLYMEYDKDVENKVHILPRDDYYNSTIQDWSSLIDDSQELEIRPIGALNAKRYKFAYKEDNDYLNKSYTDKFAGEDGEKATYGQKIVDVDNDFLTNTESLDIAFSPTPLYSDASSDRVYPRIISVDTQGKVSFKQTKVRLLYYGGLKSCQQWAFMINSPSDTVNYTTYPYCGHLSDPETPQYDLNFTLPKEIYYIPSFTATYTDNNLYNAYWKKHIEEITHRNSSIVTGNFKLSEKEIKMLDFRHKYYFKGQYFRLNKIADYDPNTFKLTKCEFIKLIEGTPHAISTTKFHGTSGNVRGTPYINGGGIRLPNGNVVSGGGHPNGQILGSGNIVDPSVRNISIVGDYNVVGPNSVNVTLTNSSGVTVLGGLQNVTVLNSSGVTVTEDNVMIVNNQKTYLGGNNVFEGTRYLTTDGAVTDYFDIVTAWGLAGTVWMVAKAVSGKHIYRIVNVGMGGNGISTSTNTPISGEDFPGTADLTATFPNAPSPGPLRITLTGEAGEVIAAKVMYKLITI